MREYIGSYLVAALHLMQRDSISDCGLVNPGDQTERARGGMRSKAGILINGMSKLDHYAIQLGGVVVSPYPPVHDR